MTPIITKIPLGITNCYILGEKKYILIDAGPPGSQSQFLKLLTKEHIDPTNIHFIFITHGHWDHYGSLKAIKSITGAKAGVSHRERTWIQEGKNMVPSALGLQGRILAGLMKILKNSVTMPKTKVEISIPDTGMDLSEYEIDGKIFHTPGHTPGSMSLILESGEAFVGDLCMTGFPQLRKTGLPVVGDDLGQVKESWKILLENNVTKIYPAHGKPISSAILEKTLNN